MPLTVHLAAAVGADGVAVRGGIPFPRGALASGGGVRLLDRHGNDVPVQSEVLATWEPARRSVRWLLVDFQVKDRPAGKVPFTLVYGPAVRAAADRPATDPDRSVWPPKKVLSSLYMVDQHGHEYHAALDPGPIIETETAGPLRTAVRAHVWHVNARGERLCRAIVRMHYFAGLDRVHVFHSFVMDADPNRVKIRGVGLRLEAKGTAARFSGEQEKNEVVPLDAPAALIQDSAGHFTLRGPAGRQGRRSGTWLCVEAADRATAFFLRNGWEEHPKAIRWDGATADLQLWPKEGVATLDLGNLRGPALMPDTEEQLRQGLAKEPGAEVSMYRIVSKGQTDWSPRSVVPLMRRTRQLEEELLVPKGRFAHYYFLSGSDNGRGSMKTHELVLAQWPKRPTDSQLADSATLVRFPPVVTASSEWNCASRAFGPAIAYGVSRHRRLDQSMTFAEYDDMIRFRDSLRLFGMRDFGDWTNGNPAMAGPLYRVYGPNHPVRISDRIGWTNLESQDNAIGPWVQFLRTGDPRLFYAAEAQTEHVATVDHRHTFPHPRAHEAEIFYHTERHYDGGPAPSHAVTSGILLGYYVTGDRGLRETAVAVADRYVAAQQKAGNGWYAGHDPSRQNTAPMTAVMNAYTLTWDDRYLRSLDRFLPVWLPVQNPGKYNQAGVETWAWSEFLRLVPHPGVEKALRAWTDHTRRDLGIRAMNVYHLPGMAYRWETSGDPAWLAYCRAIVQSHEYDLKTRGTSETARRLVLGFPDIPYGWVNGFHAAALAALEDGRRKGADLDAGLRSLQAERAAIHKVPPHDTVYYEGHLDSEGAEPGTLRYYNKTRIELDGRPLDSQGKLTR